MRAKDAPRLQTIRLIMAVIKQYEVDKREVVTDETLLSMLDKMVKQRLDSIAQFTAGARMDLVEKEETELKVIREFMPKPLSEEEVILEVKKAVAESGAQSVKEMAKVMTILKPVLQGRADMSRVSALIKAQLGA